MIRKQPMPLSAQNPSDSRSASALARHSADNFFRTASRCMPLMALIVVLRNLIGCSRKMQHRPRRIEDVGLASLLNCYRASSLCRTDVDEMIESLEFFAVGIAFVGGSAQSWGLRKISMCCQGRPPRFSTNSRPTAAISSRACFSDILWSGSIGTSGSSARYSIR